MTVVVNVLSILTIADLGAFWAYVRRAFIAHQRDYMAHLGTMPTLAFFVIAIFQTVTGTTFGVLGVDYATALYSTTLATTVICTAAIVYRVVAIGGFRSYSSIIEIVVQSAGAPFPLPPTCSVLRYRHTDFQDE
ncbi:hypothetical protein H0H87_007697 [Tephrocybe sp. NHM501043]|nr:hypothetical protein H0H87_007697 [Tephrocybe sp. NHM501043]